MHSGLPVLFPAVSGSASSLPLGSIPPESSSTHSSTTCPRGRTAPGARPPPAQRPPPLRLQSAVCFCFLSRAFASALSHSLTFSFRPLLLLLLQEAPSVRSGAPRGAPVPRDGTGYHRHWCSQGRSDRHRHHLQIRLPGARRRGYERVGPRGQVVQKWYSFCGVASCQALFEPGIEYRESVPGQGLSLIRA